jgi:HK97 family phage major capsid protein
MPNALQDKQAHYDELVKQIIEISDKATEEDRALTDEEHMKATELFGQATALKKEIADDTSKQKLMDDIRDLGNIGAAPSTTETTDTKLTVVHGQRLKSLGGQFVDSDQYQALVKGGFRGQWTTGPIELKTLLTETDGSGGDLVQPDVRPGVLPVLFRRLVVADLMPSGTTGSNTVRYLKETTATNAASTVAEGGTKPESALIFDVVDEPVRKIATWLPVTDEMLEDGPQIRSYIDNRLRLFVQLEEEHQLLAGNGVAPDLQGLMNRTGVQTQAKGGDTTPDAIYKAITLIRNVFLEPDGIIVHPNDWQDIRLLKDQQLQYYGGGPFTGAYGNNGIPTTDSIWGLRAVITPAATEGTALVGAFGTAAQVFRRGGLTVEASNSHSTYFVENKTAIRAEERLALAVYRPAAFCKVTGI